MLDFSTHGLLGSPRQRARIALAAVAIVLHFGCGKERTADSSAPSEAHAGEDSLLHNDTQYEALAARYAEAGDELAVYDDGLTTVLRAETDESYDKALRWLTRAGALRVDKAHEPSPRCTFRAWA